MSCWILWKARVYTGRAKPQSSQGVAQIRRMTLHCTIRNLHFTLWLDYISIISESQHSSIRNVRREQIPRQQDALVLETRPGIFSVTEEAMNKRNVDIWLLTRGQLLDPVFVGRYFFSRCAKRDRVFVWAKKLPPRSLLEINDLWGQ